MNYSSEKVLCPFYVAENKATIKCEGKMSAYEIFIFKNCRAKRTHVEKFCQKNYRQCKHYNAVNEKYEKNK